MRAEILSMAFGEKFTPWKEARKTDLLATYHDYVLGEWQVPGDSEQGVGVNSLFDWVNINLSTQGFGNGTMTVRQYVSNIIQAWKLRCKIDVGAECIVR
jgi:hypothetical protein